MTKLKENQKNEILSKLLKKQTSQRKLAKEYGVTKTVIQKIWAEKDLINMHCLSKTKNKISHLGLENGLLDMFDRLRSYNIPISGPMIQKFALKIAKELHVDNFKASSGWLHKFKVRNDIVFRKLLGESASADYTAAINFLETIKEIYQKYDPKDIFNCDETALFYKTMPNKSFVRRNCSDKNVKCVKERITVLLCCSKSGEKLPPLFIGKFKNPRVFKKLNLEDLEILYDYNKNAWMTKEIFAKWLTKLNQKFVEDNRSIILMLDNCTSHINLSNLSNIKLIFLPSNTTSLIQPLDAGIIKNFKDFYKNLLVEKIMFSDDCDVLKILKSTTILDAIMWSKLALDQIKVSTIVNCFETILKIDQRAEQDPVENESYEDKNEIVDDELIDVIQNLKMCNDEETDISESDVSTTPMRKDHIYKIISDLKEYSARFCPDQLQEIYLFENKLMKSAKPSQENILKYLFK